MKIRLLLIGMLALAGAALAGGPNFDRLSDDDRKAMQERFAKELWPLMMRGDKNGCVGCHQLPKTGGNMKMTGNLDKDFRKLVKDGFFIPNDSGSIVSHVTSTDRKKRMPPPGKADPWTKDEINVLEKFVADLDKKQQKKTK
jgi:hypothetical protein